MNKDVTPNPQEPEDTSSQSKSMPVDKENNLTDPNDGQQDTALPLQDDDDISITSLDEKKNVGNKFKEWVSNNKGLAALSVTGVAAILAVGGIFGVNAYTNSSDGQQLTDVVPGRELEGSQDILQSAKVIDGIGKGTFVTVDNEQGGKKVSAPMVGIDATGPESGASLIPPENIGHIGWYVRSAPPGSKNNDGTTVMTTHVNYDGVTGYGSVFLSLKKGDPVTITTSDGKEHHYVVTKDPVQLDKKDQAYTKKTMDTINRTKGKNSLILITCSGNYVGGALGYDKNTIVEAHLID